MNHDYERLETGQNHLIAAWVAQKQGNPMLNFGNYNMLAFFQKYKRSHMLKVAVIYNQYNGPNIGIHAAAREGTLWCTQKILYHIFAYPFVQLSCRRVTAPVVSSNKRCRRLLESLGFEHEGTLRYAGHGGNHIELYGLLKENCRWLDYQEKAA